MLGENGKAPQPGQIQKDPWIAETLRTLSEEGKKGYYEGRIANIWPLDIVIREDQSLRVFEVS